MNESVGRFSPLTLNGPEVCENTRKLKRKRGMIFTILFADDDDRRHGDRDRRRDDRRDRDYRDRDRDNDRRRGDSERRHEGRSERSERRDGGSSRREASTPGFRDIPDTPDLGIKSDFSKWVPSLFYFP